MKQIMAFSTPDILLEGASDAGVNGNRRTKSLSPPSASASTSNTSPAPLRMAASCRTIWKLLHLGSLPKFTNGEGSTVFWTSGCALLKHGQNKEKAAEYIKALTYDKQIWKDSIVGTPSGHPGQFPPYKSIYRGLESQQARLDARVCRAGPPPTGQGQGHQESPLWAAAVCNRQADLGRAYLKGQEPDPKAAMQKVVEAVQAEIKKG